MEKRTIFITGSTGIMGQATLGELLAVPDRYNLRLLVRKSSKNEKLMRPLMGRSDVTVCWGDLLNPEDVKRGLGNADVVLHIGAMVAPEADHCPERTMKVNVEGTRNVVQAILSRTDSDRVAMAYVGSVAEVSAHDEPCHWGRSGDPVLVAAFDYYGLSKAIAERVMVESGLKRWVVLRQSGVLHKGLLMKGTDPITFTVPLRGVLEWTTVEDSGRLMARLCSPDVPGELWNNFYNFGSGPEFRLSNYRFESLLLKSIGCPPPEKVFSPGWFATRNFHGYWFSDSDRLERLIPFREKISAEDYFRRMSRALPWYFRLAPLAPPALIRAFMRRVGFTPGEGPLDWFRRTDREQHIKAFYGSREHREAIPGWEQFDISEPSAEPVMLSHGYDESKPESELDIADMREAARFRGGHCISEKMTKGDMAGKLEWECAFGHRFKASPALVLKGGHWCPDCLPTPWRYDAEARVNPFIAQVWYAAHSADENETYDDGRQIPVPKDLIR